MNPLKLEPSLNPLKMDRVDEGRLKAGLFLYPTLLSLLSPFQYLLRVVKNLIQFPLSVLKNTTKITQVSQVIKTTSKGSRFKSDVHLKD